MLNSENRWVETLNDGSSVGIRPITAADTELERDFIERLSPDSRWFRFLNQMKHPTPELIRQLTDIDQVKHVALIATINENDCQQAVGVARYALDDSGDSAECALSVADSWQKKGLGTALMNHLLEIACARKIKKLYSIDSAENFRMQDLVKGLGFHSHQNPDDATQIIHTKYLD